jgi:hypothetical protein
MEAGSISSPAPCPEAFRSKGVPGADDLAAGPLRPGAGQHDADPSPILRARRWCGSRRAWSGLFHLKAQHIFSTLPERWVARELVARRRPAAWVHGQGPGRHRRWMAPNQFVRISFQEFRAVDSRTSSSCDRTRDRSSARQAAVLYSEGFGHDIEDDRRWLTASADSDSDADSVSQGTIVPF